MNEQLQGKMAEILSAIQAASQSAGDFALAQLPDIAQQYVTYGRVSLTLTLLLAVVMTAAGGKALWWSFENGSEDEVGRTFGALLGGGVGVVLGAILFFVNLGPAVMVWFAPKVWLLKEIAGLIK